MKSYEHLAISGIFFGFNPSSMIGAVVSDIFFVPVYLHDFYRLKKGLKFEQWDNFWVKANWFMHSLWALALVTIVGFILSDAILTRAYLLHWVMDIFTHTNDVGIRIFYPLSNYQLDLWRLGYVKGHRGIRRESGS